MRRTSTAAIILASASLIVSACSQKSAPKSAANLPPPGPATEIGRFTASAAEPVFTQDDLRQAAGSDRVLFETDSAVLDEKDQETLRKQAEWLVKHPKLNVTIEGHCDERGTREYNLALGERRAISAKNYLGAMGLDASRMKVVSFGKERPEALGSDEEAYAQNRRAVTVIVN